MKLPGNLDLAGGELQNAKMHGYTALPTYASTDAGRLIYVSSGANQGYWLGNALGGGAWDRMAMGSSQGVWDIVAETINNGVTFAGTITAPGATPPQDGIITKIALSASLSSGFVTVAIYNDAARTDKIYECLFDLASSLLTDRIPVGFELDNATGVMYISITNSTGLVGIFTLSVTGYSVIPIPSGAPPGSGSGINAGVAGDGIEYNVVASRLDVELSTNSGLELSGTSGAKKLKILPDPGAAPLGGLSLAAGGVSVDSTVLRTAGNQVAITGIKSFASPAMTPAATAGPPVAGAHVAGEFYMDSAKDIWLCTTAGTPGSWTFFGWKEQVLGGAVAGTSYTGTAVAAGTVDLALTVTGRRGVIRKGIIWGAAPAYAVVNIDAPFRVCAYPNELYEGREMLWSVGGQIRSTNFTGAAGPGATTFPINTVGNVTLDDLVRVRNTAVAEEYGRVTVRDTAVPDIDVDEASIYAFAANDPVMYCTEMLELYWKNNSAVPANYFKIYLRFFNDHPTQNLIFGYHFYCENIGGGVPV